MNKSLLLAVLLATAGFQVVAAEATATGVHAKPVPVAAEVTLITARIESTNPKTRTLMIKDAQGNLTAMKVGKSVPDFDKIKKGDEFVVEFTQAIAVGLVAAPKGAKPGITETRTLAVSGKGSKPFAEEVDTVAATAKILSIDAKKRSAVLSMPDGKHLKVQVGKAVLGLEKFKVGDEVLVEYAQELAIGFVAPKK
ncbi:MAG: hypothetical protein IPN92_18595 [Chromatiaceae bacterium]|nr:hypothetical protein [Chromatiaceae bacterium]